MDTMFYRLGSELDYQGVSIDTLIVDSETAPEGWYPLGDLFDGDGKYVEPAKASRAKPAKDAA